MNLFIVLYTDFMNSLISSRCCSIDFCRESSERAVSGLGYILLKYATVISRTNSSLATVRSDPFDIRQILSIILDRVTIVYVILSEAKNLPEDAVFLRDSSLRSE